MSLLKTIMNKLSNGTYGIREDNDLSKVVAERDMLLKELEGLKLQFEELFRVTQKIVEAKNEILTLANGLAHENQVLKAALGQQAGALGVKN